MIFKINYKDNLEKRTLIYRQEEYSFDMTPWNHAIDFELALNKLTLTVVNNKVIQLSGFCGLTEDMKSNIVVPDYKEGALIVEHNFEHGFAYGINDEDIPVTLNAQSGWVCIGDSKKSGQGVEFVSNCVAVIGDKQELVSLWLKPDKLPKM